MRHRDYVIFMLKSSFLAFWGKADYRELLYRRASRASSSPAKARHELSKPHDYAPGPHCHDMPIAMFHDFHAQHARLISQLVSRWAPLAAQAPAAAEPL